MRERSDLNAPPLEGAREALNEQRGKKQIFRQEQIGMLWKSRKVVVGMLGPFENAITSMAETSSCPAILGRLRLTKRRS